jgi:hypothetical protein
MLRILLSIIIAVFFSGCIGIGVVHSTKYEETKNIGKTTKQIKEIYSNITFVEKKENIEYFIAKRDNFDLKGIIPMIGIGIPLVFPTGYLNTEFQFENNTLIKEYYEDTIWSGFMCGILNENGKMGCSTLK